MASLATRLPRWFSYMFMLWCTNKSHVSKNGWSLPSWPVGAASRNWPEQRCSRGAGELGWKSDGFRGGKHCLVSPGLWWMLVKSRFFFFKWQFIFLFFTWWFWAKARRWFHDVGLPDSLQRKCCNHLELGTSFLVGWEVDAFLKLWKSSWVPSSKFPSTFVCKSVSQSNVFKLARFHCKIFCLSSHLWSFLLARWIFWIPQVADLIEICQLNAKCISTSWPNAWTISIEELLMRVHPPEMRQQIALEDATLKHPYHPFKLTVSISPKI